VAKEKKTHVEAIVGEEKRAAQNGRSADSFDSQAALLQRIGKPAEILRFSVYLEKTCQNK